jgi:hypothetical protein
MPIMLETFDKHSDDPLTGPPLILAWLGFFMLSVLCLMGAVQCVRWVVEFIGGLF